MRKFLLFIVITFPFEESFAQKDFSNEMTSYIESKVHSLTQFHCVFDSISHLPIEKKTWTLYLDKKGNWTERIWYQPDGISILDHSFQTFNENGDLMTWKKFNSVGKLEFERAYSYKYDIQKRKTEIIDSSEPRTISYKYDNGYCNEEKRSGRENYTIQFKYDKSDKLLEEVYLGYRQGTDIARILYAYDKEGKLKEKISYDSDGKIEKVQKYLFGKMVENISYVNGNQIVSKRTYSYNGNLHLTEYVEYRGYSYSEKPTLVVLYTYRDTVLILKRDSIPGSNVVLTTKFDSQGRISEMINSGYLSWMLHRKVWKYNSNGIPIEETEYDENNIPIRGNKYVYTYYE